MGSSSSTISIEAVIACSSADRLEGGRAGQVRLGPFSPDRLAVDEIVDVLGDVGGMVADALEVLGAEQEMRAQPDGARILHHVGKELAEDRVVERIELLIAAPYFKGLFIRHRGIGIEHGDELLKCE